MNLQDTCTTVRRERFSMFFYLFSILFFYLILISARKFWCLWQSDESDLKKVWGSTPEEVSFLHRGKANKINIYNHSQEARTAAHPTQMETTSEMERILVVSKW